MVSKPALPALNPAFSPLAPENSPLLLKRILATFDYQYSLYCQKHKDDNLALNMGVYYLRQELQALVDMWRATRDLKYLAQAKARVFKAIADGTNSTAPLHNGSINRGTWPCFGGSKPGHNQLCDFQGAAGFMLVAAALYDHADPDYRKIAQFVEEKIIEKWLYRDPKMTLENYTGSKYLYFLLSTLDNARDKREHFTTLCLDLHRLGFKKYPYETWARALVELYLGTRSSLAESAPNAFDLGYTAPNDWGVIPRPSTGGYIWYWMVDWRNQVPTVEDTSHANRTVWLAARAFEYGLIDRKKLTGFINTFENQVWSRDRDLYFNNYLDGQDRTSQQLGPGRKGNVWFGWHRLAAYDPQLKDLFISLAFDLTAGGTNIHPAGAQNKDMDEARLCLLAWGARLISPPGQPTKFP